MKLLKIEPILTDEQVKSLEGTYFTKDLIKHHITEDTKILNESGDILAVFKKNAVPSNILNNCRNSFRKAATESNNRGLASGLISQKYKVGDKIGKRVIGKINGTRYTPINIKDGKLSNTSYALTVKSGVIGYSDRYPRIPYCRRTMFNQRNLQDYKKCLPYIKCVDEFFKQYAPARYNIQKKMAEKSSQDFVIKNTAFSTVTVNKNFRTAGHYDNGDLKEGFGNLGVISQGKYDGAITVIPKYGIGLDLKDGDLAIFDVHELHGNTELIRKTPYERISVVSYYREKMIYCGNAEYELNRAKTNTKKIALPEELEKAKKIKQEIFNEL
ncbi:hypothetical protein [Winogradskyella sp. UBA3174]|uniref:hypothetical protein n=1 Tax=Winogradskyella sp. UBA3174 TaxID=1947785 RepID=UPI0025D518D7|nr:hypothetical protein [Winogradskyella sp. UBA3174]|tara:strand:- start:1247 stop:2230 length:984 start_codon:yes stop_codon:yes gene_type:complete